MKVSTSNLDQLIQEVRRQDRTHKRQQPETNHQAVDLKQYWRIESDCLIWWSILSNSERYCSLKPVINITFMNEEATLIKLDGTVEKIFRLYYQDPAELKEKTEELVVAVKAYLEKKFLAQVFSQLVLANPIAEVASLMTRAEEVVQLYKEKGLPFNYSEKPNNS